MLQMRGPTDIGFLYGKTKLLSAMPPFLAGVLFHGEIRFEAGTPAIGEAIRLGAAIGYLSGIGMQNIHDYERKLSI